MEARSPSRPHQTAIFDAGQDLAAQAVLRTFAAMENIATVPEPAGIERAIDRNDRNIALAALPAGFELPSPADYPDVIQIDTIRQNSTSSTLKMAG